MTEGPNKPESAPKISGIDLFEQTLNAGVWDEAVEASLQGAFEAHKVEFYDLYNNYRELLSTEYEPSDHERTMYEWLAHKLENKETVIELLRENPEDVSLLQAYLERREKEIKTSKDTLRLNVEVAEIYRDAGLVEAALNAFWDAANQALQEGEDDLHANLLTEFNKLSNSN